MKMKHNPKGHPLRDVLFLMNRILLADIEIRLCNGGAYSMIYASEY